MVKKGKVTNEIKYLNAYIEDDKFVAQANTPVVNNKIADKEVYGRKKDDYIFVSANDVEYMDISPQQVVSISAALIPFLANDDANRALMGSNMQRQAVPLLMPEAPIVATGMEKYVARDSRSCVTSHTTGEVVYTSAEMIAIRPEGSKIPDIYNLIKYRRSNNNTCVNQRPLVYSGQKVKAGDVIADGPSTDHGQLALGRNLLVAFMSWEGFNYEDAILVSEKIVEEDALTSIFIEEYETEAREGKLGPDEITKDIPSTKIYYGRS